MTPAFHETPPVGPAATLAEQIGAQIPVLESTHVSLQPPNIGDFETYFGIMDGTRGQYIMPQPVTRADVWLDFCAMTATWLLRGHGMWAVHAKSTGRVEGFVLIGAEPGDRCHEIGFMVRAEAEGQGIAFEAGELARDWAWDVLQVPELVNYVAPANTRSAALAERLGGQRGEDYDSDTHVYHYPHPETAQ